MKQLVSAGLIALGAIMLVTCQKEKDFTGTGEGVVFHVGTTSEGENATRTVYSGKFYDSEGIEYDYAVEGYTERIDWVVNTDLIRIYSPQATKAGADRHWDDYKITSASADKQASAATVKPVGNAGSGLVWGPDATQDFYAMYPAPGTKWSLGTSYVVSSTDASIDAGETGALISGVIPASQVYSLKTIDGVRTLRPNMNYAYMYAKETGVERKSAVSLDFHPLVTAVTFTLKLAANNHLYNTDNAGKIQSLTLSSTQTGSYLAGKFSVPVTPSGLGAPVVTEGTNEITLAIPEAGLAVMNSSNPYTFTFFLLPTDQTKLTLTVGLANGSTRKLELRDKTTGDWFVARAGKKLLVSNTGLSGDSFYSITISGRNQGTNSSGTAYDRRLGNLEGTSNVTVTSYKSKDYAATRTPVAWEVEGYYYDEACSEPVDEKDVWVNTFTSSDDFAGTDDSDLRSATLEFKYRFNDNHVEYLNRAKEANDAIAASSFGAGSSKTRYYNLSNPQNMSSSAIVETANSYIVNGAGYFRIPLVIGNGIVNGAVNPEQKAWKGWEGKKSDETFKSRYGEVTNDAFGEPIVVTTPFYDYKLQVPADVYLHKTSSAAGTPTSAYVVWEDVDGMIEVDPRSDDYTLPAGAITKEGDVYWLNFHVVSKLQGNAVIAVTDQDGTTMWSWLIWETDYVPANYPGAHPHPDQPLNENENIMQRYLGYVHTDYKSDERKIYVRIRQKERSETGAYKMAVSEIIQKGQQIENVGRNPYFAWGRKDAFWPGNPELQKEYDNRPTYYGRYIRVPWSEWSEAAHFDGVNLAFLIQNPGDWRTRFGYFEYGYPDLEETVPGFAYKKQPGQVYAYNIWNAGNYNRAEWNSNSTPVTKTIYDPSPAGYHVPSNHSFDDITNGYTGRSATASDNSVILNGIRFPLSGFMQCSGEWVKWNNKTFRLVTAFPGRIVNRANLSDGDENHFSGSAVVAYAIGSAEDGSVPDDVPFHDIVFKSTWHRGTGCVVAPVMDRK